MILKHVKHWSLEPNTIKGFSRLYYLQFLEIAALACSLESPNIDNKFATSQGPLNSFTEGAALENTMFRPRVQSTNNYMFNQYVSMCLNSVTVINYIHTEGASCAYPLHR